MRPAVASRARRWAAAASFRGRQGRAVPRQRRGGYITGWTIYPDGGRLALTTPCPRPSSFGFFDLRPRRGARLHASHRSRLLPGGNSLPIWSPGPQQVGTRRRPCPREQTMDRPLMPKATAVWLVDNTSLTFEQIAEFCGLHPPRSRASRMARSAPASGAWTRSSARWSAARSSAVRRTPTAGSSSPARRRPTSSCPSVASPVTRRYPSARSAGRDRLAPAPPSGTRTSRSASCSGRPRTRSTRCATAPIGRAARSGRATRSCSSAIRSTSIRP